MKFYYVMLWILVFFSSGYSYPIDSVSISDFRYPETRAQDLKISGSMRSDLYNSVYKGLNIFRLKSTVNAHNIYGNIENKYFLFNTSEVLDYELSLIGSLWGRYDQRKSEREDTVRKTYYSSYEREFAPNIYITPKALYYVLPEKLHFQLSGMMYGAYLTRSKSSSSNEYLSYHANERIKSWGLGSEIQLGLGWGKMRNGVFVFKALRIIQKIQDDDVLIRPLTRKEIFSIVNLLAKEREYNTNFERYRKYLYSDLINKLQSMNLFKEGLLPAYSILKVEEVDSENLYPRLFGYRFYFGILNKYSRSKQYEKNERFYTDEKMYESKNENYYDVFGFEFGKDFGLAAHFYSNIELRLPINSLQNLFELYASPKFYFELGEKYKIDLTYEFSRRPDYFFWNDNISYLIMYSHQSLLVFRYFIEDQISLSTSTGVKNTIYKYYFNNTSEKTKTSEFSQFFEIRITYDIL